jgi:AcrR family transcriptional regulator
MTRLTREESQAQTRARLLTAAQKLFTKDGFRQTSVDRIAEAAGYSKGAFYSNFSGKDHIFLEMLETYGNANLQTLLDLLTPPLEQEQVIQHVCAWADDTAKSGNWAQLVVEFSTTNGKMKCNSSGQQEAIFRMHWRQLGERLTMILGLSVLSPESLGALLYELTYAPAMSFMDNPGAGDLVRLALEGIIAKYHVRS